MAVTCQLLNVEVLVWSEASPRGFCGGQSGTGQVCHRVLGFFPVVIVPPVLCTDSSFTSMI